MTICDNCIHDNVCGLEGHLDEAMTFCADRVSDVIRQSVQPAEWIRELKELREENKVLTSECDRLIKEKSELLKKLEQIAEYKQLLKAAVEDFALYGALDNMPPRERVKDPRWREYRRVFDVLDHNWRRTDEALALIAKEYGNE